MSPKSRQGNGMSRREVLRLGAVAAAGAAVGPFVHTPARAQSFNWQRFKGKELFLIFFKHTWADEIVKYAPEFESLTGINLREIVKRGKKDEDKK